MKRIALWFAVVAMTAWAACNSSAEPEPESCNNNDNCAPDNLCVDCGSYANCVPDGYVCAVDVLNGGAAGMAGTAGRGGMGSGATGGRGGAGGAGGDGGGDTGAAGSGGTGGAGGDGVGGGIGGFGGDGGAGGSGGPGGQGGAPPMCSGPADCGPMMMCVGGTCQMGARVFFTGAVYRADFGGIAGADTICQDTVTIAQLGGHFKAWLSDDTAMVSNRLTHHMVPYYRLDGLMVATDWADLTDGTLINPIAVNEHVNQTAIVTGEVWTNTSITGAAEILAPCDNFQSTTSASFPAVGNLTFGSSSWTNIFTQLCSRRLHFYCFEEP